MFSCAFPAMHTTVLLELPRLFGMLPDVPSFKESMTFQMTGLLVVFTALGLIWLCLTSVGYYFKKAAPAKDKAPVLGSSVAPALASNEVSPEVVAVIAAAVQVTLEGTYRIQAIVPVRSGQDWAHEGRRRIFSSHQVR